MLCHQCELGIENVYHYLLLCTYSNFILFEIFFITDIMIKATTSLYFNYYCQLNGYVYIKLTYFTPCSVCR